MNERRCSRRKEGRGDIVEKKLKKKKKTWKYLHELKEVPGKKVDFWGEKEMYILNLEHFILPAGKDILGDS